MKNVTNVEFTLDDVKQETSYFDLMIQAVKTPVEGSGLGDLEEQMLRMSILTKIKKAKETDGVEHVELEDAEVKALIKFQPNVKYAILDENLIAYQKFIKEL